MYTKGECDKIMKKIELIIPDSELKDAHAILGNVNSGGMSYYTVEGSGRVKAEGIIVGRGTIQTQPELGGKIFVSDIPIAVDLRTKKTGIDAI